MPISFWNYAYSAAAPRKREGVRSAWDNGRYDGAQGLIGAVQ
jgi:hypothetical protein